MTSSWLLKMGPSGNIDRIAIELCVFGELAVKYPPPAVHQLRGGSIFCEAEGETEQRKMPFLTSRDSTQSKGGHGDLSWLKGGNSLGRGK